MTKLSRKAGTTIALTGLLLFGACAYGITKIKFEKFKAEFKNNTTSIKECASLIFNEKLLYEFVCFEYEYLLGELYSRKKQYEQAVSQYEKAIQSAKK